MVHRLRASDPGFERAFTDILATKRESAPDVGTVVADIIADVRVRGDEAVLDYTRRFDRFALSDSAMRIDTAEIRRARQACDPALVAALELAARRIEAYHRGQVPEDVSWRDSDGVMLGARWRPLAAVGLYVPGGTAAYPSSVLMNAVPARVAGVERIVMVTPTPDGVVNDHVLAAASIAGITDIYRIGGAQAVAALAYGTETIDAVDKIIGPGNAYVAEAKRQVFGTVGIDMIAGPSEVLVVADADNEARWIATDLLAQAEHDAAAQSILITDDEGFADAVSVAVGEVLRTLPRAEIARASWRDNGVVIVVDSLSEAPPLIDRVAPEHLELAIDDAEEIADRVRHAGAIFLGRHTPEAMGDYVAGPNHVLPTARSARFSSGLSTLDFVKRSSVLRLDRASLAALGPAAITLAESEGLDAHALSVSVRIGAPGSHD